MRLGRARTRRQGRRPAPQQDANLKMARYRAALDAGGDPEEIGKWTAEAKAQRLKAEAELRQATSKTTMTRQQIQDLIEECADIAADLRDGDPGEMAGRLPRARLAAHLPPRKAPRERRSMPKGRKYRQNGQCPRSESRLRTYLPSLVSWSLEASGERAGGSVDQVNDDGLCGAAGADCGDGFVPAHAHAGGSALATRLDGGADSVLGGRDDRGGIDYAAGRLALRRQRWDLAACSPTTRRPAPSASAAATHRGHRRPGPLTPRNNSPERRKTGN